MKLMTKSTTKAFEKFPLRSQEGKGDDAHARRPRCRSRQRMGPVVPDRR